MRINAAVTWHDRRSKIALIILWVVRILVKPILTLWPSNDFGIALLGRLSWVVDRLTPTPRTVHVTPTELGGVPGEHIISPKPVDDPLDDATILYLHGGGFIFCGPSTHRQLCTQLALDSGAPVYSMDYRQVPTVPIAGSVQDAMNAYVALLDVADDPTRIIVAGDSAGGYLAAKVAEIAARRGIQRPAAVIGYSPLLNLDLDDHDPAYMARDSYLPIKALDKLRPRWFAGQEAIEGEMNPVDADPALFPPMFMCAAEYELTRPDVEIMTERLVSAGQVVETHLWREQIHAWPVLARTLPEAMALIALSTAFARRIVMAVDDDRAA
ncbi:alpha/beta hydrolase [Rhodococcus chondri]|uniref:Alpha/beta hydrolase fold domain-containing protein n=1 Tax=Rhodococcus chondri TaxID=3065941 RepID=A0ABU7JRZ3_9NOCA|nr:alpha/beta hydrolase fold domain-containing protein [Rhodococcus sp. CC-R104]MEE2032801.1 alpha/beta hydrolase fold domain-containing protein [Rhodococcus sp. CC-R104]